MSLCIDNRLVHRFG